MRVRVEPVNRICGSLTPPADKSISHRAALIAAMGEAAVTIDNYLDAADTRSTLAAVASLGAKIGGSQVTGVGLQGVKQPESRIDVGNAGTLMRLLPGWLAAQSGRRFLLDGDASIRGRPVDRITEPLLRMGANINAREGHWPPLQIEGAQLQGIEYELPVASAQVKSCVLLAGLMATGATTVKEPLPSRDHTERMLVKGGVDLSVDSYDSGKRVITIQPCEHIELKHVKVPGDFSSAAFALVAAVLLPNSELTLKAVGLNWTRVGLLRVLDRMGASVEGEVESPSEQLGPEEPCSGLTVRSSQLQAAEVGAEEVPLLIDELPLVALLGCFAEGETVVRGAEELRHKESDRITTVVEGLSGLGAEITATSDGFVVQGKGGLRGGTIASGGDHRLAMLGAIAGLVSRQGVEVEGMEAAAISYPSFLEDLRSLSL